MGKNLNFNLGRGLQKTKKNLLVFYRHGFVSDDYDIHAPGQRWRVRNQRLRLRLRRSQRRQARLPLRFRPRECPLALPPETTPASLGPETLESVAAKQPEVVLIGTGGRQRFYPASILLPLTSRRIGVETMATGPACRTFNLLAAEGRKTLLILLFDRPTTPVYSTPTKS